MAKFVKYVIFCWFSLGCLLVNAQDTTKMTQAERERMELRDSIKKAQDSIRLMNYLDKKYCDSLADSVFRALVLEDVDTVMSFFPPFDTFKAHIDSTQMLDLIKIKHEAVYYQLVKDHKRLKKRAKKDYKIRLKYLKKTKTQTDIRTTDDGHRFCIVNIECGYNRKKAIISFHLMKLGTRWYLGEKLKIKPPPKEDD